MDHVNEGRICQFRAVAHIRIKHLEEEHESAILTEPSSTVHKSISPKFEGTPLQYPEVIQWGVIDRCTTFLGGTYNVENLLR